MYVLLMHSTSNPHHKNIDSLWRDDELKALPAVTFARFVYITNSTRKGIIYWEINGSESWSDKNCHVMLNKMEENKNEELPSHD